MLGIGFRMIVHPFKGDSHKLWFPSVALAFFSNCCLYFLTSWSGGTKSASINLVLYWRLRMYLRQFDLWFWPKTPETVSLSWDATFDSHNGHNHRSTYWFTTTNTNCIATRTLKTHTLDVYAVCDVRMKKKITILVQAFKFRSIPKFIVTASVL